MHLTSQCSIFSISNKNDTTINTHSGFLLHLMRPSEHLALMSYTRTPMSLAHATNWAFHLIFCTPPSASYRTVDFSRDKKVFSWSTNLSSPTEREREGRERECGSLFLIFYNMHYAHMFYCKKCILLHVLYQSVMPSNFIIVEFTTTKISVLRTHTLTSYLWTVYWNIVVWSTCMLSKPPTCSVTSLTVCYKQVFL